jgi:hypothetical protein
MADIKVETSKTAPKNTTPIKAAEPEKTLREQREEAVNGIFQLVGLGAIVLGQFADAGAIDLHAPAIAKETADLAETNEQVAKGTDMLLQVGPYAALIAVGMPLVFQVLANHNIIPWEKMPGTNVVSPDILESRVKTQMAQMAIMALQAQQEAEMELARMQQEYQEFQMASANGDSPAE